ncbi:MAG: ATP-binding protein, partial [Candidatus Eremiobacterota bacterium]
MTELAPYSDAQLEEMMAQPESDRVERKRSAGDRSAIRRAICAMANDLPGHRRPGVIFIGVNDDGSCAHLPITDELLSTLAQMRSDGNLLPLPSISVERRILNGCELIVVCVAPSRDPPVRYQGRVYVKVGPTVQQASSDEERRLAERRRAADQSFDMRPAA